MRRALPPDLRYDALFGPRREYAFFDGVEGRSFRPGASTYDARNVWWLAEASLLAYIPEVEAVAAALEGTGFEDPVSFSAESTHAFAADDGAAVVVAFRGTETGDLDDLKTDMDILLEPWPGGGRVHRGFREALDLVWDEIRDHLEHVSGEREIWFTGHSLGGALATLAARRWSPTRGLVTFGSPRVGDVAFRAAHAVPTWRVVNNNDAVSRLPPPVLYRHVGERVYVDRHGRTKLGTTRLERVVDEAAGHRDQAARVLARWRAGERDAVVWDALVDHSPLHYAIHAWNAMIDEENAR